MSQLRNTLCCDRNTSLNTREEEPKECPPKRAGCGPKILDCPPKAAECAPDVGQCPKKVECAAPKAVKICTPKPAPGPVECAPRVAVECAPKRAECDGHTKAATDPARRAYGCCAVPPVGPPPSIPNGPCVKMTNCNGAVCNAANRGCAETETIGQQFDMQTERLKSKCACVKFNGLQDTCRHPDCSCRVGCLNIPFPNCPPAQKWRKDFACKKMKKNNNC